MQTYLTQCIYAPSFWKGGSRILFLLENDVLRQLNILSVLDALDESIVNLLDMEFVADELELQILGIVTLFAHGTDNSRITLILLHFEHHPHAVDSASDIAVARVEFESRYGNICRIDMQFDMDVEFLVIIGTVDRRLSKSNSRYEHHDDAEHSLFHIFFIILNTKIVQNSEIMIAIRNIFRYFAKS